MQERYEIRGKIGQGGLGAVYRAFDRSLNREVAIKRILAAGDDLHREEAARQMAQETGALSALQHPNIVTIYDVGTDADGPFVVMELLKGETIDAIVERAPLTPGDFREFAAQVQEGLIAAQDLGLVHRDLKPSNVMVNWLPSGKFQVKLVDFGLAKFSPKPTHQTVDQQDSVYGSIFFMAPEQFERVPLDARTDMYAIGCVYYFSLAGRTPFEGETGAQVMAAHLEHRVVPLAELRPDIPRWVADWVMWHINRNPLDRPENAREALRSFIELDSPTSQIMSQEPPTPESQRRPRLIIPGAAAPEPAAAAPVPAPAPAPAPIPVPAAIPVPIPAPVPTQTAPQPLTPPVGAPPSVHTTAQQAYVAPQAVEPPPAAIPVVPQPVPVVPQAIPVPPPPVQVVPQAIPVAPPPVQAPQAAVLTPATPQLVPQTRFAAPQPAAAPTPYAAPQAMGSRTVVGGYQAPKKAGMSNAAKGVIAGVLGLVVVILVVSLVQMGGNSKRNERYNELVKIAADPAAKEVPVNAEDLEILLDGTRAGSNRGRETVYKALSIATATDGTDVDARIVEFATKELLPDDIRTSLLSRVLLKRASPSIVEPLLAFARETDNEAAAAAAIKAVTGVATDSEFDDFLDVIQFSPSAAIRKAAEDAAAEMIRRSEKKSDFATALADAAATAVDDDNRRTMIRLLGRSGGEKAEEVIKKALESEDKLDQLAAIEALRNWADDSMFLHLIEYLESLEDEQLRAKAFEAGYNFLIMEGRERDDLDSEEFWKELARNAKTEREEITIVAGLASKGASDWALSVVEYFADESENDRVIDMAEKGARAIRDRMKIREEQ